MLLAMTDCDCCDCDCDWSLCGADLAQGKSGGPAFAPALLRACPYIFLEPANFVDSHRLKYSTHTSFTMPKVGKPISKRTSTRLRNSIQKKSAEKQRKLRKQAKNVRQLFLANL
jgi:hypothetical protein